MTHLYFVRHGEAQANIEPVFAGMQGDKGLTERGRMQAERLRDRLATGDLPIDVLISSPLPRAAQTTEIIAPALGLDPLIDEDVQEIKVGEADGMQVREAAARYGLVDFVYEPHRPIAPGGESYGVFMLRISRAITRITEQHRGKQIMIVCHGGFVDGAFVHFMGLSSLSLPRTDFITHNTSITHWDYAERDGRFAWRLERYNDIAHLTGLPIHEPVRWRDIGLGPQAGNHPASRTPMEDNVE